MAPVPQGSASRFVVTGHSVQNALPDSLIAPLAIATIDRLPLPESLGQLPPGCASTHDPQHPLQHRSMVVWWPSDPGVRRWQERGHAGPLVITERRAGRAWCRVGGSGCKRGPRRCVTSRAGLLCSGLMATTKARPTETKGEPLRRLDHGQQQATNLGHRQRKQAIRRSPFSAGSSCSAVAWSRMTSR